MDVVLLELAKLGTMGTDKASIKEKMVKNMKSPTEQALPGIVRQDCNANDRSVTLRAEVALYRSKKLRV
jgi:hypothetical protein